jgi:hypothetical protein
MNLPRLVGRLWDHDLFIAVVRDFRDWPEEIEQPPPCFVVLTALETGDASAEDLAEFAGKLLDQGCGSAHSWGSDASRMELAFDLEYIDREERGDLPCGFVETSGANESLDEALWYALYAAWPENGVVAGVLVVTEPQWAEAIEARLSDPERLSDDVVKDGVSKFQT